MNDKKNKGLAWLKLKLKNKNIMKKIILMAALFAVSFTTFSQVGVGTTSPDASAALDVESTTQGFLPPRMTEAQMSAIVSPAEGLIVYCTDCNPKGIYVNDGTEFVNATTGNGLSDVTSATGAVWMNKNLGASQVATSSTDAAAYGDLYQWGRGTDGHQIRTSAVTSTTVTSATPGHGDFITATVATDDNWTDFAGEDDLWQGVSGINNPCPTDYRLPTNAEFDSERLTWSSQDTAGAFDSALKLPAAGFRVYNSGSILFDGVAGYYWSSTVSGTKSMRIYMTSSALTLAANRKANGLSVRCIKN